MALLTLIIILAIVAVVSIANDWMNLANIATVILMYWYVNKMIKLAGDLRTPTFLRFSGHSISWVCLAIIALSDVILTLC
jgi:hypothetical protein